MDHPVNRFPPGSSRWRSRAIAALATAALTVASLAGTAATLSDNLANESGGTLTSTSSDWLAASFVNGDAATSLQAVLAVATTSGTSTLSLYSSDVSGLVPDALLATFSAASSSATTASFSLTGYALTARATYWVVLSNATGDTDWSWTTDATGTGTGFTGTWASSDDGGDTYFTGSTLYPLQMSISAASAVPEPSTLLLMPVGLIALAALRARARRSDEGASA